MWSSAEHFKSSIRAGIEGNQLPLTRFAITGGFIMGVLQQSEIVVEGLTINPIRYLTTISLHTASDEIIIERHDDQVVLTARGMTALTQCKNACTSYLIAQEAVTLRTGTGASRRELDSMFQPYHPQGSGVISNIAEIYSDLERAEPGEDFFNPVNRDAHASLLEVFAQSHTWIDPLAAMAIESLRRAP